MKRAQPMNFSAAPWLVTFGDLLTLLVCFAIALTADASRKESERLSQPPQMTGEGRTGNGISSANGIRVANSTIKVQLAMGEGAFSRVRAGEDATTAFGLTEVRDELANSQRVDIEVCANGTGEPWFAALERALLLQHLTGGMLGARSFVRSAVLGEHCGLGGTGVEGESAVARISIWLKNG